MWSSLVMTPASHAGNPEFESRHAYLFFLFAFVCVHTNPFLVAGGVPLDTLPEWLRGSPAK